VDEALSANRLPPSDAPDDIPAKRTRNTAATPTDLTPGESREYPEIPGYEILGICGHGGMGVVYRARQVNADRLVALKMILAGGHASPDELARFRTEAEAIARLQHPHVVQVFEVGEHNGLPFFSLEFCPGDQAPPFQPGPDTAARGVHPPFLQDA
jgi:serine/threonine-protein kinase